MREAKTIRASRDAAGGRKARWRLVLPRSRELILTRRPLVMGVVNITPDSFSDGGLWLAPERAVAHGLELLEQGADLLDLGAESTRPGGGVYGGGAAHVAADEELGRLLPVLEGLRPLTDAPLSVDTRRGEVARRALAAGADLINDVGALADPGVAEAVAESGCPVVLMHSRGRLESMQRGIHYDDVLAEVRAELAARLEVAVEAGIPAERVILDPGIGFGKRVDDNITLIGGLDALQELGRPLLLGASRKSFIHDLTAAPVDERLPGSLAAASWAARLGAAILRVHDVAATRQFLRVWSAVEESRMEST